MAYLHPPLLTVQDGPVGPHCQVIKHCLLEGGTQVFSARWGVLLILALWEGGVVVPEKEGREGGREREGDRMDTGGEKIEDRERMEGQ